MSEVLIYDQQGYLIDPHRPDPTQYFVAVICLICFLFLALKPVDIKNTTSLLETSTVSNCTDTVANKPSSIKPKTIFGLPIEKAEKFIQRFKDVAIYEQQKYGIPASIKLAQGLLESKSGTSLLAIQNNNYFGVKCFSKTCKKGHCTNLSDDSHKDFFKKYDSAWLSFRDHSKLLQKERYKDLYKSKSYTAWAFGLRKAGYATDEKYHRKIIKIIEDLELYQYDKHYSEKNPSVIR